MIVSVVRRDLFVEIAGRQVSIYENAFNPINALLQWLGLYEVHTVFKLHPLKRFARDPLAGILLAG